MYSPSSRGTSLSSRPSSRSPRPQFLQLAHDHEHGSPPLSIRSTRRRFNSHAVAGPISAPYDESHSSSRSSLPPESLTNSWQLLTPDARSHGSSEHAREHVLDTHDSPVRAADIGHHMGSWLSLRRCSPCQSTPLAMAPPLRPGYHNGLDSSLLAQPLTMARSGSSGKKQTATPMKSGSRSAVPVPVAPALVIPGTTEQTTASNTHIEAWCSDQLVVSTASRTEREQTISSAILLADQAFAGALPPDNTTMTTALAVRHPLSGLTDQHTFPWKIDLEGKQRLTDLDQDPEDAGDHNRGGRRPPNGTHHNSSYGRPNNSRPKVAPAGSPAFIGQGSSGPSGDEDPPSRRPPAGTRRRRGQKLSRCRYPCVYFGSPFHGQMSECGNRRQYVSQLRRHHGRHDFYYCTKCFQTFATWQERDTHLTTNNRCSPRCVTETCPNYGTETRSHQNSCTHGRANALREQWRYLFQLARPVEVVPDPDFEELGLTDDLTNDMELQQSLPLFAPPSADPQQGVNTMNAFAHPQQGMQGLSFGFNVDHFDHATAQPTDHDMATVDQVLDNLRHLSALAQRAQLHSHELSAADTRTLQHVEEDTELLLRRMRQFLGGLGQGAGELESPSMLQSFVSGTGSSQRI